MSAEYFVDSNVVIYSLDPQTRKGKIAASLLSSRPSISTQVVMESINILLRKLGFTKDAAFEYGRFLVFNSSVQTISESVLLRSFDISKRYNYSHWDSLIIAAAIESESKILYSEDLHSTQVIGGVKILNPFATVIESK